MLRRDIYDRAPIFKWTEGRVALLGDSAHAMQPNLGQGGGMAIEDAFELSQELQIAYEAAGRAPDAMDVAATLRSYQAKRTVRTSAIHGMAGMAAVMASTYKAYLGEGLGPLEMMTRLHIPHPGRVGGQLMMKLTMPWVMDWVLGGNIKSLEHSRPGSCRLADRPRGFAVSDYTRLMDDDELCMYTAHADWLLVPTASSAAAISSISNGAAAPSGTCEGGVVIDEGGMVLGSSRAGGATLLATGSSASVAPQHAKLFKSDGRYYIMDLGSGMGTWLNGKPLPADVLHPLRSGDRIELGSIGSHVSYKVKMQHVTLRKPEQLLANQPGAVQQAVPQANRVLASSS